MIERKSLFRRGLWSVTCSCPGPSKTGQCSSFARETTSLSYALSTPYPTSTSPKRSLISRPTNFSSSLGVVVEAVATEALAVPRLRSSQHQRLFLVGHASFSEGTQEHSYGCEKSRSWCQSLCVQAPDAHLLSCCVQHFFKANLIVQILNISKIMLL